MRLTRLLSPDEYQSMSDKAVADGYYRNDKRIFLPGMAWYEPWYFDPTGAREAAGQHVMVKLADRGRLGFLSANYWRDWSNIRPPLAVVCPNGDVWEVDRKSSNGDGWKVEGEFPNITCTPSIVAGDYHGYLRNGEFTADIDGKSWSVPNIPDGYGKGMG